MYPRPNISVCMTVYNGAEFIRQQIQSVLDELTGDDELIIHDDLSTDETVKVVAEFVADRRVKFRKNEKKLGVVKNFERTLQEARGDYVFLCDQDDIWLPGKVDACINALKVHTLVVTDCVVVDQNLNVISPSFFELRHSGPGVLKNICKNTFLGCCMAFRRELLDIGLPIPSKMPMHDMWLGLLAQINGSVIFIDQKLSLYRRHQFAASPTAGVSNFGIALQIKIRTILIWCLISRTLKVKFCGYGKR